MVFFFLQKKVYGSGKKKEMMCLDELYDDVSIESGKANYQGKYVGDAIKFLSQELNLQIVTGTKYLNKNILWVRCFIALTILATHLLMG